MLSPRHPLLVTLASATVLAGLAIAYRWPWPAERGGFSPDLAAVRQRIEALEHEGQLARSSLHHDYRPQVQGSIADLHSPAAEILRQLPGVVRVETRVACPTPTHRIIHFRDWHFVPPDLFAADLADSFGRPPADEEADLYHRELLLQVELVTMEQAFALAALAHHHGLVRVLSEGLTVEGLSDFRDVMEKLRTTDRELAGLRKQRAGLKGNAEAIDRAIAQLVRGHRQQLLPYGAVGRLTLDQAVDVLPLDDEAALIPALPIRPDPAKLDARREAQVRAVLASGPVAVVALGASHDLSAAVTKLSGTVEYVQVTTSAVERFAGRGGR
jgi:hypothetical protein